MNDINNDADNDRNGTNEFNGKVVAITGAGRGIGAEIALQLSELGAITACLDLAFEQHIDDDTTNTHPQNQHHFIVDVTDSQRLECAINDIERNLGPIEYAVNAAGILRMGSLLGQQDKDWLDTFAVNTSGAYFFCRTVAKHMSERQRGSIVVIGSNAAAAPRINMGSYCASKAASTQLVKCLGLELAQHNIRCNIVAPGSTDTPMQRQLWSSNDDSQKVIAGNLDQFRLGVPLKRIAQPFHITQPVIFLLSDAASHITMETLLVDGGATLGY